MNCEHNIMTGPACFHCTRFPGLLARACVPDRPPACMDVLSGRVLQLLCLHGHPYCKLLPGSALQG